MDHFAGMDVSVKETSVCIVDDTSKIVREVKVASEPEADIGFAPLKFSEAQSHGERQSDLAGNARLHDQYVSV